MSSAFTNAPSSRRSRFSSRIFSEYGRRATPGNCCVERRQAVVADGLTADGERAERLVCVGHRRKARDGQNPPIIYACAPAEVHWRPTCRPARSPPASRTTRSCSCCGWRRRCTPPGYAAHSLEDILQHVCDQLGLIGQFFTTPTAIMAGFGPLDHQHTFLIRVQPGELNLGRLSALDEVAQHVVAGTLSPQRRLGTHRQHPDEEADVSLVAPRGRLRHRVGRRLPVPRRRHARMSKSAWPSVCSSACSRWLFRRLTITSHVFELTASFVASALVTWLAAIGLHMSVPTTTLAGIITLLPGLTITVAMTELASRHLSSGSCASERGVHRLRVDGVRRRARHDRGDGVARRAGAQPPRAGRLARLDAASSRWRSRRSASRCCCARVRATSRWCLPSAVLGYVSFQFGAAHLGQVLGASIGALSVGLASNLIERVKFAPASVRARPRRAAARAGQHWLPQPHARCSIRTSRRDW